MHWLPAPDPSCDVQSRPATEARRCESWTTRGQRLEESPTAAQCACSRRIRVAPACSTSGRVKAFNRNLPILSR
jgi:hypothetical protein